MTKETEKLVFSAKNGDIDAFGELAQIHYKTLTAIAFAYTKSHHLAEDAAQETLKRAILRIKTLKNSEKFTSWLSGICRNVSRDLMAKQTKTLEYQESIPANTTENDPKPEIVRTAIANLPDTDREIIILRFYNNYSYDRISEILGISNGAINGRVKRAKLKIAKYLQQNNYPES